MSAASPSLLATVPFNSGGAGTKLRRVSAIEAIPLPSPSALLCQTLKHHADTLASTVSCDHHQSASAMLKGIIPLASDRDNI